MSDGFHYPLCELPPETAALRAEVRGFVQAGAADWPPEQKALSWTGFDRAFSRELGRRGWIGMTWPKRYGGGERTSLERYVVLEELLAAGAPVGAHWIADRQSGPLILRVGTEAQKERFLPAIVRGEMAFCIGMSEPDAGSDLAAIRSRAVKVDGGWRLDGRKIWTTNAQHCDFMIGLFRTAAASEKARQAGLTQFLIDCRSSGIEIRPIRDLSGEAHFNEITFDNVFVPEDLLIGAEGQGWAQVNAELALERSGPDRYLSSFPLLTLALDSVPDEDGAAREVGRMVSELVTLREMSLSVAGMLQAGHSPLNEAALVKDLGTGFEQRLPETVRALLDPGANYDTPLAAMLAQLTQVAPVFSLRGGTREILRGMIARGLGLR